MTTIYDIIEENNRLAKMQADLADVGAPFSDQKLGPSIPRGGDIFTSRFDNFQPAFMNTDSDEDEDYDSTYDASDAYFTPQNEGLLDLLKAGGSNFLDFIQGGGFIGGIGRGITSLGNFIGDRFKGSRFYNPRTESGNRLFAPGSRAGDQFGLGFRRDANRFANMLNRLSQGKKIGRSNLSEIMGPTRLNLPGVNVDEMAKSIQESAKTGYGGYGSSDAAAAAAASGGRDYSSSPGAMAGDMEYDEE
jgi:hypothetical protein